VAGETDGERLPRRDKLLYASGSLAGNVLFQAVAAWLLFFYARPEDGAAVRYVPVGVAGALLAAGRLVESFDDPAIGHLSDNFRSRLGRRVPFILFGAPLLAAAFVLLWTPPVRGVSAWNAVYFFLALQVFFLLYTVVRGPFSALLPEIARTSEDRVSVSAWEVLFGAAGAAVGLVVSGLIIEAAGFVVMGLVLGAVSFASHWLALLGVRGHTLELPPQREPGLIESVRTMVRDDQFLAYQAAFLAFTFAQSALTATLPFLIDILLRDGDVRLETAGLRLRLSTEGATSLVFAVYIGVVLASVPVLQVLARRFGKRRVFAACLLTTALYMPVVAFVGFLPGLPRFPQVFLLLGLGATMAGVFVLPNALLSDVIDRHARLTGRRREATFFGMQGTVQRVGFSLSAVTVGAVLAFLGDSPERPWGVRAMGPIAGLVVLAGYAVFRRWYRLP
jgi:GPH family glycoside/pentoside/hexuronide:cation symporter